MNLIKLSQKKRLILLSVTLGVAFGCLETGASADNSLDNKRPSTYFYQAEVTQERLGKTDVLMGRILPDKIEYLNSSGGISTVTLGSKTATSPQGQPEVEDPTSNALSNRVFVEFFMDHQHILECTQFAEFKTFLQQLPILKESVRKFKIYSSSSTPKRCIESVAKSISALGIRTEIDPTSSSQPFIKIKGYLSFSADGSNHPHAEDAAHSWGKLSLRIDGGTSLMIPISSDGQYFRSFPYSGSDPKRQRHLQLSYLVQDDLTTWEMDQLTPLSLGSNTIQFNEATAIQVKVGMLDRAERIEAPAQWVDSIIATEEERKRAKALAVGIYSMYSIYSGAGSFGSNASIVPLAASLQYRINDSFSIHSKLLSPFKIMGSGPTNLFLAGSLDYSWFRNSKRRVSAYTGLGAYYNSISFSSDTPISNSQGYSIAEILGIYVNAQMKISVTEKIALNLNFALAPMPPTSVNSFTLSTWGGIGPMYCLNELNCLLGELEFKQFKLNLKDTSAVVSNLTNFYLGYIHTFP